MMIPMTLNSMVLLSEMKTTLEPIPRLSLLKVRASQNLIKRKRTGRTLLMTTSRIEEKLLMKFPNRFP
jgi:uncharacterized protein YceH (UPF0502 family)